MPLTRTLHLADNFSHLETELNSLEQKFAAVHEILHEKRNLIKKCTLSNEVLVVKSFKKPDALRGLIYGNFRQSKAKRSYQNAQRLIQLNISTPPPVAFIEHKKSGMLGASYYIAQFYDHDFTMHEVMHDLDDKKLAIIKAFTQFTYSMHEKNVLHLDHNAGNTLIKEKANNYQFSIIDINRMKFKSLNLQERLNNFVRLTDNTLVMQIIANTYAECIQGSKEQCQKILTQLKQVHVDRLNRKKYLKKCVGAGSQ